MWHKYKILGQKENIELLRYGAMPVPSYATLHLSYSCNQHCRSCAYAAFNKDKFIPEEAAAFNYVNQLIDYGVKAFDISGGGDPSTLPYIVPLIEEILKAGCNYSFVTNGWKLSKELIKLISSTATYVRVSLETGDPVIYSRYKRVSQKAFEQVIKNIEKIAEIRHPDTELSLKFDVDRELFGANHINSCMNVLQHIPVDAGQFKAMAGPSRLSGKELLWHDAYITECMQQKGLQGRVINSILNPFDAPHKCWLSPLQVTVDGKGIVYLCCYYYDVPERVMGNLNEASFAEIWEGPLHQQAIDRIQKKDCQKFDCKFFSHHTLVDQVFKRGRLDII